MVGIALFCLMASTAVPGPPLIPAPAEARFEGALLRLDRDLKIYLPAWPQPRVADIAAILCDGLRDQAGVEASVQALWAGSAAGGIALSLDPRAFPGEPEAYRIDVGRFAAITASDPRGLLWGVQTFLQCLEPAGGGPAVRRMTISDRPRRPWRGLMLDPVRSFLDLDFVRRTIRVMSAYKLNVLHLHLTDDEAWRFESRAWPKCNRPGEPLYTQDELRALVAFARRYGVEVVPEFDVPGHSMTAVAAYPELDCERRPRPMNEAIFCAGRPFTLEFIDRLVAEAAEVFPSAYIHLGADEPYAIKRWAECPDCRARMAREGVASVDALYHIFVRDLDEIAKRHGKRLIVWNDAIHPGIEPMPPGDILIDAWYDWKVVGPLAEAGFTVLNSSQGPLYLTSFGLGEGLPLAAVLGWDATRFPDPPAERGVPTLEYRTLSPKARILGGHASAWATEQSLVERRLYPRLLAMAEDLWAEGRPVEPADFEARLRAGHAARLKRLGVPDDDAQPGETPFGGGTGEVLAPGSGGRGYLVSPRSYRDFRLSFELRGGGPDGQTGVSIRCAASPAKDAPPQGLAIAAAPPPGRAISSAARLAEGWTSCEVVARGAVVSLTVNGVLAWSVVDPNPRSGPIVINGTGPGHEFRNLRLRVLEEKE
jgi:hexosaminidase